MKKNILFLLFGVFCSAQNYTLDKTKEFVYPELKIESPVNHLKMFLFFRDYNPINAKVKSVFSERSLKEYDSNGNLISETTTEFNMYDKKTVYTYKNGILIERKETSKADKDKIKRTNEENERQAKRDMEKNGVATTVGFDAEDTEDIYGAELDKKDRIISATYKSYKIINGEKKLNKESSSKIDYSGNKITKVKSGNAKYFYEVNYFYDGNLLTGMESMNGGTEVYQQSKKIYKYQYNKRKNLVAVYKAEQYYTNGKTTDSDKPRLQDSANYDDKNRMIWHGNLYRYETFKYDKNNSVTEFAKFNKDKSGEKQELKQEYQYDDKNNLIRYSETDNRSTKPRSYSQKFIYENGLLKEVQNSSEQFPIGEKIVYQYDDKNRLIKKSTYVPKRFKDKNAPENEFELGEFSGETQYIYGDKSLVIKSKYGTTAEYTFY